MNAKFYKMKGVNSTPFNSGLKTFDSIIGMQNKENRTWRIIAITSMLAFFLSLGLLLYAIKLPKTVPMVITVSDFGEAKYVGNISKLSYNNLVVPDVAIEYQIRKFITNSRTISTDSVLMKENIRECYSMLTSQTQLKLSNSFKENNPFAQFGNIRRNIEIESVIQVSPKSYQVDFLETDISLTGAEKYRTRYRAVVSIVLLEPPEEKKRENPLGIYISDFDIKQINALNNQ